jgi:hypothetical protein
MSSSDQEDSKLEHFVVKPAVVGGVAYAALSTGKLNGVYGSKWSDSVSFATGSPIASLLDGRTSIPMPMLAGLGIAAGSLLSEVTHNYLFPHIHWLDKSSEKVSLATAGAIAGAGTYGVIQMSNDRASADLGLSTILLAAVVSEFAGDYVYGTWINLI